MASVFSLLLPLLFLLISTQNSLADQPANVPAHLVLAGVQANNLQAKARLASCQHAVGVLLLQGYVQIQNGSQSGQQQQPALVQIQQELQQSIDVLKKAYSGAGQAPSTESILECVQLYAKAYGQVNGGADSGVGTPATSAEITTAIGVMMRRTSQLQASLQE